MGKDRTGAYTQRLTVAQSAGQLGISEGAVRNRIKRGTLRAEREAGRVYVLLAEPARSDKPRDESELVAVLREQLAAERQAHAEARRIIAGLVERIPSIAAPQEPSEVAEADEEDPERSEPRPYAADSQTLQDRSPGGRPAGDGDAATDGQDTYRGLSVWAYWLGVILTGMTGILMQSGVGYRILQQFTSGLPESDALPIVSAWGLPLLLPIIFGYLVGRRPRGSNFWRHVGVTALLSAAASFLLYAIFTIPQVRSSLLTSNEPTTISFQVTQLWLPVALAFLSSALIGNANRRRVAGPTPAAGFASKQWSPLAMTLMGTAGNILAAVITGIFALAGT